MPHVGPMNLAIRDSSSQFVLTMSLFHINKLNRSCLIVRKPYMCAIYDTEVCTGYAMSDLAPVTGTSQLNLEGKVNNFDWFFISLRFPYPSTSQDLTG